MFKNVCLSFVSLLTLAVMLCVLPNCSASALAADSSQPCTDNMDESAYLNDGKKLGWSSGNPKMLADNSSNAHLQVQFPIPGTYTVQLNIQASAPTSTPVQNAAVRAEALITWSVSGNSVTRRVTVGQGTGVSVTGAGEAVRVVLTDATINKGAVTPGYTYSASINVVRGSRGSDADPPVWIPQFANINNGAPFEIITPMAVVPGTPVDVSLPGDLGGKTLYVQAIGGTTGSPTTLPPGVLFVRQQQLGGGVATVLSYFDVSQYPQGVPLIPGCNDIHFFALGSSAAAVMQVGIDG